MKFMHARLDCNGMAVLCFLHRADHMPRAARLWGGGQRIEGQLEEGERRGRSE